MAKKRDRVVPIISTSVLWEIGDVVNVLEDWENITR